MVILTGKEGEEALRGRVPEIAIRRAKEMRGEGVTVVAVEPGDDVRRDFRFAGRYGLLTYLDDCYQAPFEYVRFVHEGGRRVFEALLATSGKYLLVVPDEDWVDDRLRVVLDVEGEETASHGEAGRPKQSDMHDLDARAKNLVGRTITRISLRARRATGVEVRVTGRWEVTGCIEAGGLILGPSLVPEVLPGHDGEVVTGYLHVESMLDRASFFGPGWGRGACDGVAFLVDADEAEEEKIKGEMVAHAKGYDGERKGGRGNP